MLVANKVDDPRHDDLVAFYELGLGEPLPVSAMHGTGTGDLLDELSPWRPSGPRGPERRAPHRRGGD